ncbi:hypothetical protein B0H17DRAFT_1029223 [Mycena rosella]|uniref:Late embryogenesis abundant protein LEA-2 subgroup domain-containing protein n=1 Tax=Mycena rosella TaxID=1033263 RepID=A0AAD7H0Z7_MYCRO|nr:hypothetical protein B0H17DRAFT_1029223 [Mycena rosella]
MSYQDPYAGQYGGYQHQHQQPQYAQPQYGQQQYGQYADPAPEFNPYTTQQPPHQSYEQGGYDNYGGGYRDDPAPEIEQAPRRQPSYAAAAPSPLASKSLDETSRFDAGEFSPGHRGPKTASNLRQYRMEFQGHLWTRGGRGRCFGRFFCCTFMILVFLFVTIVLALVLWLRPPSLTFGDVGTASGTTFVPTADGININMGVNISVNNPNFFAVNFKKITAEIYYPINNTAIGNGVANNIVLSSNAQTNFTFPFTIDYSTTIDPKNLILLDLAQRCGILGTKTNIVVDYKITLGLQILFVPISPSISNSFSFACPLPADEIQKLLKSVGLGS